MLNDFNVVGGTSIPQRSRILNRGGWKEGPFQRKRFEKLMKKEVF